MKKKPQRKVTKKKKPARRSNRKAPLLGVAAICERLLQEDTVMSMIRMIDTFNITGDSKEFPPGVITFEIYLMFKSGEAVGERTVELVGYSPSGKAGYRFKKKIKFEGGEQGVGLKFRVVMTVDETGVYWFHVKLNRQDITKIPLTINYKRVQKG